MVKLEKIKDKACIVGNWLWNEFPESKALSYIGILLATILLGWFTILGLHGWGVPWQHDFPSYHLPFIARNFNLSTWNLVPSLLSIWEGYPPLVHYIQGLMFLVSDYPMASDAIHLLGALIFIPFARFLAPKLDVSWLLVSFFGLPLYLLNFPTGGFDDWFSLGVLVQFMALASILKGARDNETHLIFILAAGLVMVSKMNGWPVTAAFSIVYGFHELPYLKKEPKRILSFFALLAFCVGYWPLRNWIIFGSPVWPMAFPFAAYGTSWEMFFHPAVRPEMFSDWPRFAKYFISFFEVTRFVTDEPMKWSFTMWHGGPQSPHQMMGGLNGAYMLALIVSLGFLIKTKRVPKSSVFLFVLSMIVASILNQSHEMRYSLYVPMILLFLNFAYAGPRHRVLLKAMAITGYILITMSASAYGPNLFDWNYNLISTHKDIAAFWQSQENKPEEVRKETTCIPNTDQKWWLADPLGIYFTGPHLREYSVRICREECRLPWQHCGYEW